MIQKTKREAFGPPFLVAIAVFLILLLLNIFQLGNLKPLETVSNIPQQPTPFPVIPLEDSIEIKIPILMYHYIGYNPNPNLDYLRDSLSITPPQFEEQLKFLKQVGVISLTFEELFESLEHNRPLPQKALILTFDDGYVDFYVNAYPLLKKYKMKAVAFIATGLIGKTHYLNWDQIKEMKQSGLISFQPHSVSHTNLTKVSLEDARKEILQSREDLQTKLSVKATVFAYPYGKVNKQLREIVKEAGFKAAVTNHQDASVVHDRFSLPRIGIHNEITLDKFQNLILNYFERKSNFTNYQR